MNIEIEQLYGVWRHIHGNIYTDFNIRRYDEKVHKGFSIFTIYNNDDRKIIYEWQGVPRIVNYPDKLTDINIDYLQCTENMSNYQDIKIWHFTPQFMVLEFGNGQKVEFNKISQ